MTASLIKNTIASALVLAALTACSGAAKKTEAAAESASSAAATAKQVIEQKQSAEKTEVAKSEGGAASLITCVRGQDSRSLSLNTDGKGCQLIYKKYDKETQLAQAKNGKSYCEKIAEKVKSNLAKDGYSCTP